MPPLSSMPGATNYRDTRKPGLSPAEIGTIASLGAGPFIVGAEGLGAGRKTANNWNQSFHDPMMAKFNTISTPEQLLDWWQEYLTGASNFATGGTGDFNSAKVRMSKNYTVIAQALLKTPGFLQALDAKWQQVGGPGKYGLPSLSSTMMSTQGGNGPRIFQSDVGATIQTALDQIGYWRNVINLPGAKDEPEPAPPGARPDLSNVSDKPPTQPPGQTPPVTKVPGAPDLTKPPLLKTSQDFLDQYGKWLLGLGTVGAQVYAAVTGNNAIKDAADIQAKSAAQSLDLQRNIYNTTSRNQMPWLQVGQQSLYRLSDLMGLPQTDRTPITYQPIPPISVPGAPAPNPPVQNPMVPPNANPLTNAANEYHRYWNGAV